MQGYTKYQILNDIVVQENTEIQNDTKQIQKYKIKNVNTDLRK